MQNMDRQFLTLVKHFFGRFFDKESRPSDSDSYTGLIQLLTLIVLPGFVMSFFMMTSPGPASRTLRRLWGQVGDHYSYVCYGMVVMGMVMTFKWDSLFPDRRDYMILSSLPITVRRLFAAKVVALAAFLSLFVIAINICSMFIVPITYPNPQGSLGWLFDAFLAHGIAVIGASLFTALFFAALQGVLINVMTPAGFRRISPRIQMVSISILVMVFLTLPLFKQGIRPLTENYSDGLSYMPFIWFLGLYESFLPGDTRHPMFHVWAFSAIKAFAAITIICVASYAVGYRRYSKKLLESLDSDAIPTRWWQAVFANALNRTLLRDTYQRATFYFIGKIANRSNKHRIMTALYMGAGIALAISFAFVFNPRAASGFPFRLSPLGSLEAPVMLAFLFITGLRASFNIPYELGANWIFRTTGNGETGGYLKAVRKWVFVCRIIPLYIILAPLEFTFFPPDIAIAHILFDLALAAVVIELFFVSFNKVPFTCSYPTDKFRLAGLAVGYLYGFITYVGIMGLLKRWAAADPRHLAQFLVVAAAILAAFALNRRRKRKRIPLVYQDEPNTFVRTLDLS